MLFANLSTDTAAKTQAPLPYAIRTSIMASPAFNPAQDRGIGRVVVRLSGAMPTANSLRLPRRREDSLNAAGRFLYIQLHLEQGKPYAIHADLVAADRGLHRVSVSNLYAAHQGLRMKRSGVQVFLPAAHDGWMLLALDLTSLAQQASRSPHAKLRALHLCANMTVRGAFTSDVRYDWQVNWHPGI
jgi:hypothetical protein